MKGNTIMEIHDIVKLDLNELLKNNDDDEKLPNLNGQARNIEYDDFGSLVLFVDGALAQKDMTQAEVLAIDVNSDIIMLRMIEDGSYVRSSNYFLTLEEADAACTF